MIYMNFKKHDKLATITTVKPQGRFGSLALKDDTVTKFIEKPMERVWLD